MIACDAIAAAAVDMDHQRVERPRRRHAEEWVRRGGWVDQENCSLPEVV